MIRSSMILKRFKLGTGQNKQWPQIVASITICCYSFLIGVQSSWMSPSVPKLISNDSYIPMTFEETAYFAIFQSSAMIVFSFVGASIGDILGRKRTAYVVSILQVISWLLIGFAKNVYVLHVARTITGITDAFFLFSTPYYISETTEKHIRGRMGILVTLFFSVGVLYINIVGYYLSIPSAAFVMAAVTVVHFCIFFLMPESPYWLIQRNRSDEAKQQLQLLRWREDVDKEFTEISEAVRKQSVIKGSYKELFMDQCNRRALIITLVARIAQQSSGFSAVNNFLQLIFAQAGGGIERHISASICALVSGATCLGVTLVIDRYGRRPLILLSSGFTTAILFIITALFYLKFSYGIYIADWLPLLIMMIYIITQSMGLAMIPSLTMGELFSAHIKCNAGMIINMTHGAMKIITAKTFQVMVDNVGLYSPFLIFGCASFIFTFILYFVFIETKNKTLDEIQIILRHDH